MYDHIIKATTDAGVRMFAAVTTNLAENARRRHDCYPIAAAALGRTMTAALLFAANLKADESITVRISGDGPLGEIVADAHVSGIVRGYVRNPKTDLPLKDNKLDIGGAVGQGHIFVTRFTGLKEPFTGTAELVSGEIAEDVTNYLYVSEQTPSSVALGVLVETDLTVGAAGGFMIQALPGVDDAVLTKIEENLAALPPVSQLVKEGKGGREIVELVFAGLPINIYEEMAAVFQCPCTQERLQKVLISLGAAEIDAIIEEDGKADITCNFCAEKYHFDRQALEEISAAIKAAE